MWDFQMVEDVGFEPRLLLPKQVCYHYTTSSIETLPPNLREGYVQKRGIKHASLISSREVDQTATWDTRKPCTPDFVKHLTLMIDWWALHKKMSIESWILILEHEHWTLQQHRHYTMPEKYSIICGYGTRTHTLGFSVQWPTTWPNLQTNLKD